MRLDRRTLIVGAAATLASRSLPAAEPAIRTAVMTLRHPSGRATDYRLMAPAGDRPRPVVLFSHGANSAFTAYDRLWAVWAARGYAVIGPNHIDTGPPATQAKPPAEGLLRARLDDTALPLRQRAPFEAAAGPLDWGRVAAAGHSFGAVVAQALAGARLIDPTDHRPAEARLRRVGACLAFSPPGPLPNFIPADAWSGVSVPSLLQTGDADVLPGFVDDWHSRLIGFAGAKDRWSLVGHGVDHYFGGLICRLKPTAGAEGAALDETASLSATLLDAALRRDPAALAALQARARLGDDGVARFAAA